MFKPTSKRISLCRRYCAALRRELSPAPHLRRRAISDMQNSLEEFLDMNPNASWQDLEKEFGTPHQAAENILNSLDSNQIRRESRYFSWRRILLITVFVAALAYVLLGCGRIVVSRIMHPSYVVVGSAVVDEGPMPTNTPIEERGLIW